MPDSPPTNVLASSVERLAALASPLDEQALRTPAYPSEWSIAQVLSHLGSGAEIFRARLEAALGGPPVGDEQARAVWAAWDAKPEGAQRDDALAADAGLLARIRALTGDEQARFRASLGPMELDFPTFVKFRLNEHVLHTWDIEVALDAAATLPTDAAGAVIDNLGLIAGFAGKPVGDDVTIGVATTDPVRSFRLDLRRDRVALTPDDTAGADITMPSEAFVRLVYGRLDPDHTPTIDDPRALLALLRRAFPGM